MQDLFAMADGDLTLHLDEETAKRLRAAADAAGRPAEEYAADVIAEHLADDLEEDLRIFEDYERTGVSYSLEEGMAIFDAAVKRRFGSNA